MLRGIPACFMYVLVWIFIAYATEIHRHGNNMMWLGYSLLTFFSLMRATLSLQFKQWFEVSPVLWFQSYSIAAIGTACTWAALSTYALYLFLPGRPEGYLIAIASAGFGYGGAMSLLSHAWLQRSHILLITVPTMLVCLFISHPYTNVMAIMFFLGMLHLLASGQQLHQQYQTNLIAKERLAMLATTDELTGISNRRDFEEHIYTIIQYAARHQHQLLLFLIDVDNFKKYNDTYGHRKGDDCLVTIAATVKSQLRRGTDMVARYGGEEFIGLVADTSMQNSLSTLQQIIDSVLQLTIPHCNSDTADIVSISVGAIQFVPDRGLDPAVIIEQADQLLYRAKNDGRNRGYLRDLTTGEVISLVPEAPVRKTPGSSTVQPALETRRNSTYA